VVGGGIDFLDAVVVKAGTVVVFAGTVVAEAGTVVVFTGTVVAEAGAVVVLAGTVVVVAGGGVAHSTLYTAMKTTIAAANLTNTLHSCGSISNKN